MKMRTLINCIITIVICAVSLVSISYAWEANNRNVNANDYSMQLDAEDIIITEYAVYQYVAEQNAILNTYNEEGVYVMNQYDSIFLERNVNTPLMFVAKLENARPGTLDVVINCDPSHTDPSQDFSSNIVYLKAATKNAINSAVATPLSDSSTPTQIFETCVSYFQTDNVKRQFVTASQNGSGDYVYGEKSTYVDLAIPLTAADITDGIATVCVIIDYDETLIAAQNISHFSDMLDLQQLGGPVPFVNDITRITFMN